MISNKFMFFKSKPKKDTKPRFIRIIDFIDKYDFITLPILGSSLVVFVLCILKYIFRIDL